MPLSDQLPPWLSSSADGVFIDLVVQPRASKNEICGVMEDRLKIRITSPPVEGAANKLCCSFFAKQFKIAKSNVAVFTGEKSRQKRIVISGLRVEEVLVKLTDVLSSKLSGHS